MSGRMTLTALSTRSLSGLILPLELFIALVRDLRDAAELLRERFGGARRFVAPRPARRLLNKDGLLRKKGKKVNKRKGSGVV